MLIIYSKRKIMIHYTFVFLLNWILPWMTVVNVLAVFQNRETKLPNFCRGLGGLLDSLTVLIFSLEVERQLHIPFILLLYCDWLLQLPQRDCSGVSGEESSLPDNLRMWSMHRKFGNTNDYILASSLPLPRPWIWTHHAEVLDCAWDSRHNWFGLKICEVTFKNGK